MPSLSQGVTEIRTFARNSDTRYQVQYNALQIL